MSSGGQPQHAMDIAFEDQVIRKVFRRLMSFLFVLMMIAYLDRINIGFAALSMNQELKLTATMFGLASSIFYAGYVICEIPSNMMLARFGARRWIGRILITWGIASAACMFAVGAHSLYGYRFILGITEAGFMPGVLLYLTYWFPPTFRARATALFLLAQPVTLAIGASASGVILEHANGFFGLSGWRWLFLIEGLPAVLLGFVALSYLSDGPSTARWLTDRERNALQRRLEREQNSNPAYRKVWREIFSRNLLVLALMYFGMVTSLGTMATWTPQIVRELVEGRRLSFVGFLTAIPPICAFLCMQLWGARSDKKMERTYHYLLPMGLATAAWVPVAFAKAPELRMLGLVLCYVGVFSAQVIFWAFAPHIISPAARPVGLAFITSCGNAASIVQMTIFGFLRDLTHDWAAGLVYVMIMLFAAAALVLLIPANERVQVAPAFAIPVE